MTASAVVFLIARLQFGLGFTYHGAQKLGFFDEHGPRKTASYLRSLGFRPAELFAIILGLVELIGGLLITFGFLGAIGPALIIVVMLVATCAVHLENGFSIAKNGWELCASYVGACLVFSVSGFGKYSLDEAIGLTNLSGGNIAWCSIAIAGILALLSLAARCRTPRRNDSLE